MQKIRKASETVRVAGTAVLYAVASGAVSVLIPIIMVLEGYAATTIGVLALLSGASQLLTRFLVPSFMRLVSSRTVVLTACLSLAMGVLAIVSSPALIALIVAQILHGASRAFYWTGLQTHAVRTNGSAIRGLTTVNLFAGLGMMLGPAVVAVVLNISSTAVAILVALSMVFLAFLSAAFISVLPAFETKRRGLSKGAWTSETQMGSWMAVVAGSWKGLLDAYVPVLLIAFSYSESLSSLLVAFSNGSILLGSLIAPKLERSSPTVVYLIGLATIATSLAAVGVFTEFRLVVVVGLIVAGLISGLLQTVGPAIAADSVSADDRGDAIAITGIFRSTAILGFPGAVVLAVSFVPLSTAFILTGGVLLLMLAPNTLRNA